MESKNVGLREYTEALEAAREAERQAKERLTAAFDAALGGEGATHVVSMAQDGKGICVCIKNLFTGRAARTGEGGVIMGEKSVFDKFEEAAHDLVQHLKGNETPPKTTVPDLINAMENATKKYGGGRVYRCSTEKAEGKTFVGVLIDCGSMKDGNYNYYRKDWGFVWQKLK